MSDEIKAAETRGYQRGYQAGKRRKEKAVSDQVQWSRESAFWRQAMLAALPFAMTQSTWKRGEEPINSIESRVQLAVSVADATLARAKTAGRM